MFRLWAILVLALLSLMPHSVVAAAETGQILLDRPCFLVGAADADPVYLLREKAALDCTQDPRRVESDTIWVRFDVADLAVDATQAWTYQHKLTQARDEQVWVMFAGGRIRKSVTVREESLRLLDGPTQRFKIAAEPGKIDALLVRVDGIQNRRGPVPRAMLLNGSYDQTNRASINLGFGVLAGIMLGIFLYNLTLFAALRYRVLAAYCGFIAVTLFYGTVWSNLIFWFAPNMTIATQFGWNALAISMCFLASAIYLESFVEPGVTSRRIARVIYALCAVSIVLSIARIFYLPTFWRAYDSLTYLCYLGAIALIEINCIIAWRRGSTAVKFLFIAWAVPIAVVVLRIFWGMGTVTSESAWLDASPFISLAVEAVLSAIGLSWRLRQLRSERDSAKDQADELYTLANMDPLTGIANRRCFHGRAMWEGARNENVQLILIDVDKFKFVNDGYGHDAGDIVLKRVADAVAASKADVIGRLGGDEFAIVTPNGDGGAMAKRVADHLLMNMKSGDLGVTLSMGIASGPLKSEADWQMLYIAADKALYESKRGGRAQLTDRTVERRAAA